jgi:ABC-type multidrug transport system fused ATPase/permease subunit
MFGEIVDDAPKARNRVDAEIIEAVEKIGARPMLERAGLHFDVGTGGAELTRAERQKVALARALIKGPQILVMNGATTDLDPASEEKVVRAIRSSLQGRFIICVCSNSTTANLFDRSFELKMGRLVEPGGEVSRAGLQSE